MFEQFEAHITALVPFTSEELKRIRSFSIEKKLRKKQLLLHEGEVCRHKIFVVKGLLRNYNTGNNGTEYIMRFSPENSWAIESESYNNQTPTKYNIDALENSEVILWPKENFDVLMEEVPAFKAYSERLRSNSLDASQNRILMNISYTTEEKYMNFLQSFPDVFDRVPLHMVASYLGVSRETLSRVRHQQLKRY